MTGIVGRSVVDGKVRLFYLTAASRRPVLAIVLGALLAACGDPHGHEGSLLRAAATDSGLVAVGAMPDGPLVLASADGRHWERARTPSDGGSLTDVAFGNGTIVAVGPGMTSNAQMVVRGPDGVWRAQPIGTNNLDIVFGNGVFLTTAGVEPGAAVSPDGVQWTGVASPGVWVGFDGQRFVSYAGDHSFRTSADGVSWSAPSAVADPMPASITSLAVVGDQVLGFGYRCSNDAVTCSLTQHLGPRGTDPWNLAITNLPWADDVYALGHAPTAITTDGTRVVVVSGSAIHATPLPVGSAGWSNTDVAARGWSLVDVSYRAGTFLAVGTAGRFPLVVTSADGTDWKEASLP